MSTGGKGSSPRPYSVDQKTFDTNWDRIFGKKSSSPESQEKKSKITKINNKIPKKDSGKV